MENKLKPKVGEIWEVSCDPICHDLVLIASEMPVNQVGAEYTAYFLECSDGNTDDWEYETVGGLGAYTFIRRIEEAE